jgi:nucleotide-binding universal stress UspA family protein
MFKTDVVLHPTDFSEDAHRAFKYAYELAELRDAELHLLHVAPSLGDDPLRGAFDASLDEDEFYKEIQEEADEKMQALIRTVEGSPVPVRRIHSRGISPAAVITEYAESESVDLIVMGTEGRTGVSRLVLGSVAGEVVRKAPCAVMTVRQDTKMPSDVERVLAPVDLSEFSRPLLRAARDLTASFNASMDVMTVVEPLPFPVPLVGAVTLHDLMPDPVEQSKKQLDRLVKTTGGLPVSVETYVKEGHAAMTIVDAAEDMDADMIVMASHGRTGLERIMLGSVTARVVRHAPCPVCVLRVAPEEGDDDSDAEEKQAEAA